MSLNFHESKEAPVSEDIREGRRHRGFRTQHHTGVAIAVAGAAVIGAGAAVYGANKNAKAIDAANKSNADTVNGTNALNYKMWLESRGVGENGQAINSKLPRWMNWAPPAAAPQQNLAAPMTPAGFALPSQVNGSGTPNMTFGQALQSLHASRQPVVAAT